MGWLDKAKVFLGIIDEEDIEEDEGAPRAQLRVTLNRDDRPPLDDIEAVPQETLEDVLVARDAGDIEEMRTLLRRIDRGRGLRLVFRAAAALEAGDEDELKTLLPKVRDEKTPWKLPLQLAAALNDERGASWRARAAKLGAPKWALGWMNSTSQDAEIQRQGLVDLLFADAALARTVAARDLGIDDVEADTEGAPRYVGFAHGRDCIRRFGAAAVADLLDRAWNN